MPEVLQRHFLRKREARSLLGEFCQKVGVDAQRLFGSEPRVELAETQTAEIFVVNEKPFLARSGGVLFPTLVFGAVFPLLPRIVVDMGAVPHICGGADVMAPGVVRVEGDFNKGDPLLVVDERHERSLAIGFALFDSKTTKSLKRGKIAKNVHHVGDKLWGFVKLFT